jgi:hypothetical protein
MSTRSTISIETPEGIRSIYCHFDGSLEYVGSKLKEHYNTPEKINALINLGSISSLSKDFDMTVAYHRDRKEPLRIEQVSFLGDISAQDYNYVFKDGVWSYWRESHHFSSMKEV